MASSEFYESTRALGEYLLFHYGAPEMIVPYESGPRSATGFPTRLVSELLDRNRLPKQARAIDAGCAVGASAFELAKYCQQVVAFDFSHAFVNAANQLRELGFLDYEYVEEGEITSAARASVPDPTTRDRTEFHQADAMELDERWGTFDVALAANLIDRVPDPGHVLDRIARIVKPGGQLLITSPYTWLEDYTPREKWLGGQSNETGDTTTLDGLKSRLASAFHFERAVDIPFLIREHRRKYQWSVAQGSVWIRVENT